MWKKSKGSGKLHTYFAATEYIGTHVKPVWKAVSNVSRFNKTLKKVKENWKEYKVYQAKVDVSLEIETDSGLHFRSNGYINKRKDFWG